MLEKNIERAYVVTKSLDELGPLAGVPEGIRVMRLPAPLLYYWIGSSEIVQPSEMS
jgi:uncharacterized protein